MSQSRDVQRAQVVPQPAFGLLRGQAMDARPHLSGIATASEPTSGIDLVLAQIFVTMRGTLGWSRQQVALRLGTTAATVELLEIGNVGALPPWSETLRVIETYGLVVGVDMGPVLDRLQQGAAVTAQAVRQPEPPVLSSLQHRPAPIAPAASAAPVSVPVWYPSLPQEPNGSPSRAREKLDRTALAPAPSSAPRSGPKAQPATRAVAVPRPPQSAPSVAAHGERVSANDQVAAIAARLNEAADTLARTGRSRRQRATLAAASIAITVIAVGALLTALPSSTTSAKPDGGFTSTMRMGIERIVDGLRWIDVSDPKTRKADRLAPVK